MNKKLKKIIITAAIAVAACGAVWGGLTIARNAQRGDVNVYSVSDFAMTNYWGDTPVPTAWSQRISCKRSTYPPPKR